MNNGFQALVEYFKNNDWRFLADEERRLLQASFTLPNGNYRCIAAVDESDEVFQFFCQFPLTVPPEKRAAVAELCLRVSYRLKLGGFELDFDDGELRLHAGIAYPDGQLADAVIQRVVGMSLIAMDVHFQAFMRVIYGGCSPAQAALQAGGSITNAAPHGEAPALPPSRIAFN